MDNVSSKIKYSLIIPHYNDDTRLRRLLISFLHRPDIQVIVVDDCSPSQGGLTQLKNDFSRVEFFSTPRNLGAGAARNIGLSKAEGELILFADSDDEFLSEAFEIFDEQIKADAEITYFLNEGWAEEVGLPSTRGDDYNTLCLDYLADPSEENLVRLKLRHCVPWSKVYRRSFIEATDIKFDETIVANDVYFNIVNALLAKKVNVSPLCVYRVYRLSDSLTSTMNSERLLCRLRVTVKLAGKLKEMGIKEKLSGAGWIAESVRYGLPMFAKVVWIVFRSDMKLNLIRGAQPKSWLNFINNKKKFREELQGKKSI